jgi:ABC-2 type transport system ATP-binding protein
LAERPNRTLVLTTHYLMEADELCDRVAVIDRGRVLACDTPAALKRRVQRYTVFELGLTTGPQRHQTLGQLPGVQHCTVAEGKARVEVRVALKEEVAVGSVVRQVLDNGAQILSLKKVEPTLEDVFVELVGHGLRVQEVDA